LQDALAAPALVTSQVHQVAVYPVADAATPAFDAETLATLSRVPHVRAAWGQIGMSGTFASGPGPGGSTPAATPPGELVSLPPLASSSVRPSLSAGRMPSSDASSELLLTDIEAAALGFQSQTFGDQFRNFEDLLGKLRVALLGLALVALLLACLGIANTMYTAVLERTKEIGVLKALGARSRDVLLLFIAEAVVLG